MTMIDSKHIKFNDLDGYFFRVPDYQRSFVWKTGVEIGDFWDDFQQVANDIAKEKEDSEFF